MDDKVLKGPSLPTFIYLFSGNNRTNKQADTIMLGWPLNWNMSRDIQRNDLERYEIPETDDRSPAMTWSWFTIGWRWVNEPSKVENYFEKSYRDYMIQPFKVRITKKVVLL